MFDFFIALDGHGLNGFEGFAGIARLRCDPARDRWEPEVRFFHGVAGGHATQLFYESQTHVVWLDDDHFVTAIGPEFWRFALRDLEHPEPIGAHGVTLP